MIASSVSSHGNAKGNSSIKLYQYEKTLEESISYISDHSVVSSALFLLKVYFFVFNVNIKLVLDKLDHKKDFLTAYEYQYS